MRIPRKTCLPRLLVFLLLSQMLSVCSSSEQVVASSRSRIQPIRMLQEDESNVDRYLRMTLRFSVWFPDFTDDSDYDIDVWSSDPDNTIRKAVLNASLQTLCDEGDMMVVAFGDDFDPSAAQDICVSRRNDDGGSSSRRRRRRLEVTRHLEDSTNFGAPSILADDPHVMVRLRARDRFTWSIWTLRYTVLQIGDLYIQEALQNEPGLQFSELAQSSTNAMQQVAQLALDLSIMEGTFDLTLVSGLEISVEGQPVRVHSSPIRREVETFGAVYNDLYAESVYEPETFSIMRISGVVLLLFTISTYFALPMLAKRRRRMLTRKAALAEKKRKEEKQETGVLLDSPQGVEDMLQKSSFAATTTAPAAPGSPQKKSSPTFSKCDKPKETVSDSWDSFLPSFMRGIFSDSTWKAEDDLIDTAISANLESCVRSILPNTHHTKSEELVSAGAKQNDSDSEGGDQDRGTGMLPLPQNLKMQIQE